jgi:hypothetical protein
LKLAKKGIGAVLLRLQGVLLVLDALQVLLHIRQNGPVPLEFANKRLPLGGLLYQLRLFTMSPLKLCPKLRDLSFEAVPLRPGG